MWGQTRALDTLSSVLMPQACVSSEEEESETEIGDTEVGNQLGRSGSNRLRQQARQLPERGSGGGSDSGDGSEEEHMPTEERFRGRRRVYGRVGSSCATADLELQLRHARATVRMLRGELHRFHRYAFFRNSFYTSAGCKGSLPGQSLQCHILTLFYASA